MKLEDISAPSNLITVMKDKEGIDLSDNICKELTPDMVEKAERVIVMARREILPDFRKR